MLVEETEREQCPFSNYYFFLTLPLDPLLEVVPLDLVEEPDLETVDFILPVLLVVPELLLTVPFEVVRIALFFS